MNDAFRPLFPVSGSSAFLLLTVLMGEDEQARAVWERWCDSYQFDDLDPPSLRLMMTALPRLERLGVPVADQPRIRGLRRRSYCINAMLWRATRLLTTVLGAEGIPAMLIKGLPLSVDFFEPGERYSADADVLVRRADYARAQAILEHRPEFARHNPKHAADPDFDAGEIWCVGSSQIDLHARPCHEYTLAETAENRLWARARPITGLPYREDWDFPPLMPAPEDLILQQAVHLTRRDRQPYVFVDMVRTLARHGHDLNWDAIINDAIANRMALRLGLVLGYLVDNFEVNVPRWTIERLQDRVVSFETHEMTLVLSDTRWNSLIWYWFLFCRRERSTDGALRNAVRFPRYLYRARGRPGAAETARQVTGFLSRALNRRL